MGYSIMTPFIGRKAQQKMLNFLDGNFRGVTDLIGENHPNYLRGPTDDVSYNSKEEKHIIGFDYKPSGFDRAYGFRMCTWMAVTAGKKQEFHGEMTPFIIYDGDENIFILKKIPDAISKRECIAADDFGFYPLDPLYEESNNYLNRLIQDELKRLSKLYMEGGTWQI